MKYYATNERIDDISANGYPVLMWVSIPHHRPDCISTLRPWSNGFIFEAAEGFPVFYKLVHNYEIIPVTDAEYSQILLDNVTFFDKEKTKRNKRILDANERMYDKNI